MRVVGVPSAQATIGTWKPSVMTLPQPSTFSAPPKRAIRSFIP
jgi:hypothetical protein